MNQTKDNVLFLCSGNSCRSQMAEAFLRKYAGDRFNAYSAAPDDLRVVYPTSWETSAGTGPWRGEVEAIRVPSAARSWSRHQASHRPFPVPPRSSRPLETAWSARFLCEGMPPTEVIARS
jgi:hypothetical protein